jgi:hypothetical protein
MNRLTRIALYIIAVFLLLFIVVFFLNCGTANAMGERERVRKNKIDHVTYSEHHQQLSVVNQSQATDCERVEVSFEYANYLNNVLFRYTLIGRWCYDGEDVVWVKWSSPDKFFISSHPWNVWGFRGSQPPENAGGPGREYAFRRNTGTFGVDIAWFHHTETVFAQCTVRGDGTSTCGKTH